MTEGLGRTGATAHQAIITRTAEQLVEKITRALEQGISLENVEQLMASFYGHAAEKAEAMFGETVARDFLADLRDQVDALINRRVTLAHHSDAIAPTSATPPDLSADA